MQRSPKLAILLVLTVLFAGPTQAQAPGGELHPPRGFMLLSAARPAGEQRFLDQKGGTVNLSAFQGRVVLLSLWATWCPSCRQEMMSLDMLQNLLGSEGLTVLPISVDRRGLAVVAPFYRENELRTLPMFFDPAQKVPKGLQVSGLPTALIISRDGWEIGRVSGWRNWMDPQMVVFLRSLLQKP